MGVLQDQIQAVRNNSALTPDERRAAIYQIKVDALFAEVTAGATDQFGRFLGKTYNFNGFEIIVHAVGATTDPALPKRLVLDLTLTKGAESFRDTYYVTNPPVIAADGTENLLRVMGEMVTSWWRGS